MSQLSEPNRRATLQTDLPRLAARIAAAAPARQGSNVYNAGIPWRLIIELRELLDQLDVDWRRS
jgi:hypothetical protein